ncbi:MAG: cytochrome c [Thermoanaerobaculia bacterium]
MRSKRAGRQLLVCAALAVLPVGCDKLSNSLHQPPSATVRTDGIAVSALEPGARMPGIVHKNPLEGNPFAISEGQRLYDWYNCSGCHFRGGGGIGPPLMDEFWIYGGNPANIYTTIVEGRPNGMPAFRGKIPDYQLWQIVAYVQSMRADKPIASPPGPREDHLQASEGKESR